MCKHPQIKYKCGRDGVKTAQKYELIPADKVLRLEPEGDVYFVKCGPKPGHEMTKGATRYYHFVTSLGKKPVYKQQNTLEHQATKAAPELAGLPKYAWLQIRKGYCRKPPNAQSGTLITGHNGARMQTPHVPKNCTRSDQAPNISHDVNTAAKIFSTARKRQKSATAAGGNGTDGIELGRLCRAANVLLMQHAPPLPFRNDKGDRTKRQKTTPNNQDFIFVDCLDDDAENGCCICGAALRMNTIALQNGKLWGSTCDNHTSC